MPRPASWPPLPRAGGRDAPRILFTTRLCPRLPSRISAARRLLVGHRVRCTRTRVGNTSKASGVAGAEGQSTREPWGRGDRKGGVLAPHVHLPRARSPRARRTTILPVCAQHVSSGVCLSPPPAMSQLKGAPGPLGSLGPPHPRWSLGRGLGALRRG